MRCTRQVWQVSSIAGLLLTLAAAGAAQSAPPSTVAQKPRAVINLNTATAAELQGLPGVGPKTAARILEFRQKNGGFKKIEELMNVRGIGEKAFLRLKNQITVAPARGDRGPQIH